MMRLVAQFNQVIGLEPNRPSGYAFKGAVLEREGKFDEAMPLLQKANDLQPSAQAVSNVGFAYYGAGNIVKRRRCSSRP